MWVLQFIKLRREGGIFIFEVYIQVDRYFKAKDSKEYQTRWVLENDVDIYFQALRGERRLLNPHSVKLVLRESSDLEEAKAWAP